MAFDLVDHLAGLTPGHPVAVLRHQRGEARQHTQGSFEALFEGTGTPGLPPLARELAALRVASLLRSRSLAEFHRLRALSRGADPAVVDAAAVGVAPAGSEDTPLARAQRQFIDRLTLSPSEARREHLDALQQAGLGAPDIVTLAQLVAFVNYLVRLLAGLSALAGAPATPRAVPPQAPADGFTLEPLAWAAWLPTVDAGQADAEQLAVLDESHASARTSPYYLTLLHDAPVLRQRSRLFNAIMYAPGGLARAERELATVAVSRINGCPYCASVHARLFAQLSKKPEVVQGLLDLGVGAPLSAQRRAVVDIAVALTRNPAAVPALQAARTEDLDDLAILDAVHAAAIFAWANRLMQTLGEPVQP